MKTRAREMVPRRPHLAVHLAVACFVICSRAAMADNLGEGFCFRQRTPSGKRGKCFELMERFRGSDAKISTAEECCAQDGAGWAEKANGKKCLDSCNVQSDIQQQSPEEEIAQESLMGGVWGEWGEWTPCPVSCGEGIAQRRRQCDCGSDSDMSCCNGQSVQREPCNTNVMCPVHGQWGDWSQWSECSATCGETMTRSRECDSPAPEHGGEDCTGDSEEVAWCNNRKNCPINGRWRTWSSWSRCSITCGRQGIQNRYRSCTAPKPDYGGLDCDGDMNDQRPCSTTRRCPIDGGWSEWKQWHCPKECEQGGDGIAWRIRSCSKPFRQHGGKPCEGKNIQRDPCSESICAVNGAWGEWSSWGECSSSCGTNGFRIRKRQCDTPPPSLGGYPCHGNRTQAQTCENIPCIYNSEDGSYEISESKLPCDDEDFSLSDEETEGGTGSGCASGDGSSEGDSDSSILEMPEYADP